MSPSFDYTTEDEIVKAYSNPIKNVTLSNIKKLVPAEYNDGILKIESIYHGTDALLFNVTYACRLGNRSISSGDGSSFEGIGFIHLTGRYTYKDISKLWNADKDNSTNQKAFHDRDKLDLSTNIDVAIKASLYYWKKYKINNFADGGMADSNIQQVSGAVNAGNPDTPTSGINNLTGRKTNTDNAYKKFTE